MPPFEPENPAFAAMVAASFARQGLMRALGIELVEVTPGGCVLAAAADPRLTQQQGLFHGALIGAMLDCAGGYAGYSLMPPGSEVLTTEYKINFIAPAAGERLIARGRVIFCRQPTVGERTLRRAVLADPLQIPAAGRFWIADRGAPRVRETCRSLDSRGAGHPGRSRGNSSSARAGRPPIQFLRRK